MFVQDLDAEDPSGLRVVFGVGRFEAGAVAELRFRAVSRGDIAEDVLGTAARPLPAAGVLADAVPAIVKSTPNPAVRKDLRADRRVAPDGTVDTGGSSRRSRRSSTGAARTCSPASTTAAGSCGICPTPGPRRSWPRQACARLSST